MACAAIFLGATQMDINRFRPGAVGYGALLQAALQWLFALSLAGPYALRVSILFHPVSHGFENQASKICAPLLMPRPCLTRTPALLR